MYNKRNQETNRFYSLKHCIILNSTKLNFKYMHFMYYLNSIGYYFLFLQNEQGKDKQTGQEL